MKIRILKEDCDISAADDRSLPCTAFLIGYENGGRMCYDIAMSSKQVDIFDHYWDKYGNVKSMVQTEGRISPKLWTPPK